MIALVYYLASCQLTAPATPEVTQPDSQAVFTSAAQTAEARRLERFAQTSSPQVEELIDTVAASTPTPTIRVPTQPLTPTRTVASPTSPPAVTAPPAATGDRAEFVRDVTIPDGTVIGPEQSFVKTWRLRNIGETTWTTNYSLVFIDGDLLGASPAVALPKDVPPNQTVDIPVSMVAPTGAGTYRSYWKLRNASGEIFGIGVNRDEAIWVEIKVESSAALGEAVAADVEDRTVADVSLSVNNQSVNGSCPYTFMFTARFTLNKAATLTYNLEAGDDSGSTIKLPPPTTRNMGAGERSVVYELTFAKTTSGWARLRITDPEQMFSNQVNFYLTC